MNLLIAYLLVGASLSYVTYLNMLAYDHRPQRIDLFVCAWFALCYPYFIFKLFKERLNG